MVRITTISNFKRLNGTYMEALPEEIAVGERESVVDFSYHLGVMTGLHVDEISLDLRLCIRCENVEMGKHFKKKYDSVADRKKLVYYDLYNPDLVEAENVRRTGYLASRYGVRPTVVRTSAAASVEALESVKWLDPEMKRIETCPHYLVETVDNAKGLGDADLLVIDLQKEQTITPTLVPMNSDFSIFEGRKVKGWPVLALRRGEVLARDGKVVEPKGKGVFLRRTAR